MPELDEIHNDIIELLNEEGTDILVSIRGDEYPFKSAIVDPRSIRTRGDLPDWLSKSERVSYISFKVFENSGLIQEDIKDIEKVYYKGAWFRAMGANEYGILENSSAWVIIGIAK